MLDFTSAVATAVEIAVAAPKNRDVRSVYAQIPWSLIEQLRADLDRLDIDWRSIK